MVLIFNFCQQPGIFMKSESMALFLVVALGSFAFACGVVLVSRKSKCAKSAVMGVFLSGYAKDY